MCNLSCWVTVQKSKNKDNILSDFNSKDSFNLYKYYSIKNIINWKLIMVRSFSSEESRITVF
jgi:hypothetical protein